ncbi:uncharacterized protein LOC129942066 [Eupeodes corollae]|uniref:uncharacterized protein LOC129942066 n=1 Tax=Eupeodes corollae TaxID=290404 RepID=UPI00248F981A|nr:uncharacterized protein LOC129942066 [Eupeodes corollae]
MDFVRPILNCLSKFCSCINCAEDLGTQGLEPNERTHLLVDPVNNSPALRRTNSDNLSNEYSQSLPKKDEQNALSRLVQNTEVNMIDVGAMDSHNIEHQEYNDRIKLYNQRLMQQWNTVQHPGIVPMGFLKDIPNPEYYLTSVPISAVDLAQIKSAVSKAKVAVDEIRVEHNEDIVVPFRIP